MSEGSSTAFLLRLTADIVVAQVTHHEVEADALPPLIRSVYHALADGPPTGEPSSADDTPPKPAVSPRQSVFPDYIVCLEDGRKLKMLKRHLQVQYAMTPAQYRAKWDLPPSYPMVAPAYAKMRSNLARASGLGRKPDGRLKAAAAD